MVQPKFEITSHSFLNLGRTKILPVRNFVGRVAEFGWLPRNGDPSGTMAGYRQRVRWGSHSFGPLSVICQFDENNRRR